MLFIQFNRPLQDTSAQEKLKIALEDSFTGNQSTDSVSVASSQKNNECSEKLSEAQVTKLERESTKLNVEARGI